MFCEKCGVKQPDNAAFCSNCGNNLGNVKKNDSVATPVAPNPEPKPMEQAAPVPQPVPRPAQASSQQPIYQQSQSPKLDPLMAPLSVGSYMGMFILLAIPIVNLVMLCIWLFGSTTNKNKKNFAIAMVLFTIIMIVLTVLLSGALAAIIYPLLEELQ